MNVQANKKQLAKRGLEGLEEALRVCSTEEMQRLLIFVTKNDTMNTKKCLLSIDNWKKTNLWHFKHRNPVYI